MLFFRLCVGSFNICWLDCFLCKEIIIHRSTNLLSVNIDFRRHTLCYSSSKIIDDAMNLMTALRFDYGLMKYAIINSIKLFRRWYVYHLSSCCSFIAFKDLSRLLRIEENYVHTSLWQDIYLPEEISLHFKRQFMY